MKKVIFALVAASMTMTSCMNEEFPNATSYGQLNVNVSNDLQMNTRASVSDLSTWISNEYKLNKTYADDKVAFSEYLKETLSNLISPFSTSITGFSGLLIVLSSSSTSTIRFAAVTDIEIITNIIETIRRLIRTCIP